MHGRARPMEGQEEISQWAWHASGTHQGHHHRPSTPVESNIISWSQIGWGQDTVYKSDPGPLGPWPPIKLAFPLLFLAPCLSSPFLTLWLCALNGIPDPHSWTWCPWLDGYGSQGKKKKMSSWYFILFFGGSKWDEIFQLFNSQTYLPVVEFGPLSG